MNMKPASTIEEDPILWAHRNGVRIPATRRLDAIKDEIQKLRAAGATWSEIAKVVAQREAYSDITDRAINTWFQRREQKAAAK